ncbi:hypothetical protein AB0O28_19505 [Microbispora sp. NPDC088329]|uniref:hypothetical protein n=1 Tax=Microbispora sp. NPDC088329 TaxID=3154869 RepID=UPI00342B97F7
MTGEPTDFGEATSRGRIAVRRLLGSAVVFMTTDEIMSMSRDERESSAETLDGGGTLPTAP